MMFSTLSTLNLAGFEWSECGEDLFQIGLEVVERKRGYKDAVFRPGPTLVESEIDEIVSTGYRHDIDRWSR